MPLYFQQIKEISFKSSFFNSDINKLVSVIINDILITNNVEERRSKVVETILKPLLSKQNSSSSKYETEDRGDCTGINEVSRRLQDVAQKMLLDFRNKKLPHSLIMFAQVSISVVKPEFSALSLIFGSLV